MPVSYTHLDVYKRQYERYETVKSESKRVVKKELPLDEDLNAAIEYFVDQVEIAKLYVKEMFWDTKDWIDKIKNNTEDHLKHMLNSKTH